MASAAAALWADEPDDLSPEAVALHVRGLVVGYAMARPGVLTDAQARTIGAAGPAVEELTDAGLWRHTSRGYRVCEDDAVRRALGPDAQFEARVLLCEWRGAHRPDAPDEDWQVCLDCGAAGTAEICSAASGLWNPGVVRD